MTDKELKRRALLGDREAQQECTRSEIVLPCPKCGKGKIIYWDKKMKWYSCWDCGLKSSPKKSFEEALSNWNTRPAPPVGRCRDCKFYTALGHCQVHSQVADECGPGITVEMLPDDFCSYFTPKEESPCPPKSK